VKSLKVLTFKKSNRHTYTNHFVFEYSEDLDGVSLFQIVVGVKTGERIGLDSSIPVDEFAEREFSDEVADAVRSLYRLSEPAQPYEEVVVGCSKFFAVGGYLLVKKEIAEKYKSVLFAKLTGEFIDFVVEEQIFFDKLKMRERLTSLK